MSLSPELKRKLYRRIRWQGIRKRQLLQEPTCRYCAAQGFVKGATIVDHIKNPDTVQEFYAGPFQSLCKDCHDTVKRSVDRGGSRPMGFDANGYPLEAPKDAIPVHEIVRTRKRKQ